MMRRLKNAKLERMKKLAAALAIKTNKQKIIIGLVGGLGSGKTSFVKAFAKNLNIKHVKSPTFTIINSYRRPNGYFYHLDLYRLKRFSQLTALGFKELISKPSSLILIEWADKFKEVKKNCNLIIKFDFGVQSYERNITIIEK